MRRPSIRHALLLVVSAVLLPPVGCGGPGLANRAVPAYTAFRDPQRVVIRGYEGAAMEPFVTRDGRYLLFNNLNVPTVNTNLHYAERVDDLAFDYRGEIAGANSAALEGVPTMAADGTLCFVSTRSYDQTLSTLYCGRFTGGTVTDIRLLQDVSKRQRGHVNFDIEVSADGAYAVLRRRYLRRTPDTGGGRPCHRRTPGYRLRPPGGQQHHPSTHQHTRTGVRCGDLTGRPGAVLHACEPLSRHLPRGARTPRRAFWTTGSHQCD